MNKSICFLNQVRLTLNPLNAFCTTPRSLDRNLEVKLPPPPSAAHVLSPIKQSRSTHLSLILPTVAGSSSDWIRGHVWMQMYKIRSSRKIDSRIVFSRE